MNKISFYLSRISWERIGYTFVGMLAYFLRLFMKPPQKPIWVFGSGNGLFENNIQCFYSYCLNNQDLAVTQYFITDKVVDESQVNLIKKGSLKAYLLSFRAQVLVFDTGNSDIIPGFLSYTEGLKVNLNHGQEGLKKLSKDYYKIKTADLLCAVSEFEQDIKINECGAESSNVVVTGQPRYDKVNLALDITEGDILLFFTWREGMQNMSSQEFSKTDYIVNIISIINSCKISETLAKYDKKLYIKLHHMLPKVELPFEDDRIIIVGDNLNLTKIINASSLLITDYSSVCWDFIYNDRPVIFYPFDYDVYSKNPGLYLNMKSDSTLNSIGSITQLERSLESTLGEMNSGSQSLRKGCKYFKYRDTNNCLRIYEKINNLLD